MNTQQKHVYEVSLEADSDRDNFFQSSSLVTQTGFFRLNNLYSSLENIALPALSNVSEKIQIWSAGCSDGREPYSIAMTVQKWFDKAGNKQKKFELRASDINSNMIQIAKNNQYEISRMELSKLQPYSDYFRLNEPLTVEIKNEIAGNIKYFNEDIFKKRFPQKKYHLIICTNVLFYYELEYRKIIVQELISSLLPNGFIFLESIGSRYLKSCGLHRINSGSHLYHFNGQTQ